MFLPVHVLKSLSSESNKYPRNFCEIYVLLIVLFPLAYSCFLSVYWHAFQNLNLTWKNVIVFESGCLCFIFFLCNIFTAALVFFTGSSKPTPEASPASSTILKRYLSISLWVGLAMFGYNILSLGFILSTMIMAHSNSSFHEVAEFAFVLFLVSQAYVIAVWVLSSDRFWVVDQPPDGYDKFSDMKMIPEPCKGVYWTASVVMCGLFAIFYWVIQSTVAHKVFLVIFISVDMIVVGWMINLVYEFSILVSMGCLEN